MMDWRATPIWLSLVLGCPGPDPHAREALDGAAPDMDAAPGDDASSAPDAARDRDAAAQDVDSGLAADAGVRGCQLGDKRCDGDTPQTCDGDDTWISEAACSASAPICNSGTCGKYRLLGAISTLGKRPAAVGVRLKNEGIQTAPRVCNTSFCVTGGIQP